MDNPSCGYIFCLPFAKNLLELSCKNNAISWGGTNIICFILFLLSSSYVAASTYNPFIYFRFFKKMSKNNLKIIIQVLTSVILSFALVISMQGYLYDSKFDFSFSVKPSVSGKI